MPFTEHVRELLAQRQPSPANTAQVGHELRRFVRRELRSRRLLDGSPQWLGIVGGCWDDDALNDLVSEVYTRAILQPLAGFVGPLRNYANITPLIRGNVGRAISDLQREHDPVGARVRANVRGAVRDALSTGTLEAFPPPPPLQTQTRLNFAPPGNGSPPASEAAIAAVLNNEIDLRQEILCVCRTGPRGRAWVSTFLGRFPPANLLAFLLGTLVAVLDREGRSAWQVQTPPAEERAYEGDGEEQVLVRLVRDSADAENAEAWQHLRQRVALAIDALDAQDRVKSNLRRVFESLCQRIGQGITPRQSDVCFDTQLPRQRVSDLMVRLREILERCRSEPRAQ